jgi:hypothetical protein
MSTAAKTRGTEEKEVDEVEEASPLLRLPGELRNKIYHLLTIEDSDQWREGQLAMRKIDDFDFTLDTSNTIVSLQKYKDLSQTNRQLRGEVQSYLLDHGMFHIKYKDLDLIDTAREKMLRISSVAIDITSASYKTDAAPAIARMLLPLCKEGRLRKVFIKGNYGEWKHEPLKYRVYHAHAMDLVAKLSSMMNVETTGHDVTVQNSEETPSEAKMRYTLQSKAMSLQHLYVRQVGGVSELVSYSSYRYDGK